MWFMLCLLLLQEYIVPTADFLIAKPGCDPEGRWAIDAIYAKKTPTCQETRGGSGGPQEPIAKWLGGVGKRGGCIKSTVNGHLERIAIPRADMAARGGSRCWCLDRQQSWSLCFLQKRRAAGSGCGDAHALHKCTTRAGQDGVGL